jgi:hypothetical protein
VHKQLDLTQSDVDEARKAISSVASPFVQPAMETRVLGMPVVSCPGATVTHTHLTNDGPPFILEGPTGQIVPFLSIT